MVYIGRLHIYKRKLIVIQFKIMLKGLPVVPLFCSKNFLNDLESVQFVRTILIIDSSVWKFISICLCHKRFLNHTFLKFGSSVRNELRINMDLLKRKRDKYSSMINGDETGRFVEKQR